MNAKPNNLNTSTREGKDGPLSPQMREKKQQKFLKVFRETGNIKYSCKIAGINRSTYYDWRDNDDTFKAQLPDAKDDACDVLELAALERAVHGVDEPVVSQGQLVYEYEPVVDEHGEQRYDDKTGKLMVKRGKQVMKRVYSDTLLIKLLSANLPQKYREKSSVELTGKDGGPITTRVDLSGLSDQELDVLDRLVAKTNGDANDAR